MHQPATLKPCLHDPTNLGCPSGQNAAVWSTPAGTLTNNSKALSTWFNTPRMPLLTKCSRLKYSSRSFWMGVPDNRIRRSALRLTSAWYVWFSEFFKRWPWNDLSKQQLRESSTENSTWSDMYLKSHHGESYLNIQTYLTHTLWSTVLHHIAMYLIFIVDTSPHMYLAHCGEQHLGTHVPHITIYILENPTTSHMYHLLHCGKLCLTTNVPHTVENNDTWHCGKPYLITIDKPIDSSTLNYNSHSGESYLFIYALHITLWPTLSHHTSTSYNVENTKYFIIHHTVANLISQPMYLTHCSNHTVSHHMSNCGKPYLTTHVPHTL